MLFRSPTGDTAPEIAADRANVILLKGNALFSGSDFNIALRAANLMPGAGNAISDYKQSYSRAEIEGLRAWLAALAASGKTPVGAADARELNWNEKVYLSDALDRMDDILGATYASGPAAGAKTLLETVRRPGEESLSMTRLALALEARPRDAAFALKAQEALFQIVALSPAHAADADAVLSRVLTAVEGTSDEAKAVAALETALKGPNGAALKGVARAQADLRVHAIAEELEASFPHLGKQLVATGLRDSETSWRDSFKLRHYRALRALVETRSAARAFTAGQRAVIERARTLLPLLESLGAASGVPEGDLATEAAAEVLNPALQNGYAVFTGSVFNEQLKAAGLLDQNAGTGIGDRKQAYTQAETIAIRIFLKAILASGQGWDTDGTRRALTAEETAALTEAIVAADQALSIFSTPGMKLHAFSPLALAALPAAFGLAPWLIFAALALGAAWLAWKFLPSMMAPDEGGAAPRASIPGSVIARHRRLALSARRMATAVNGGSFRSRFIGPGGTDFAEARPYQGEDMREMDWKTSAKKGELYAKKFELERDMPLMLVVDISASGDFGTTGTDKRTAIEDAAAVLAMAAAHSNVRVGLVLVSDRVEQVIPARGGQRHAMMIVDAILKARPSGTATDLKPGLAAAGKLLGSRAMVAILSDFIAPDFKDALGAIASRHDVRAIRVTDPAELGPLPDVGLLPVVDAETGVTRMLDTSSKGGRAEAAAAVSRREAAVENAFAASRINPISLSTEGDPLEALEHAFHPKAKQPFKP